MRDLTKPDLTLEYIRFKSSGMNVVDYCKSKNLPYLDFVDVVNKWNTRYGIPKVERRKNFLFCQNEDSANRTCKNYTVIESCKLCGVDPYKYLCEILSREPEIGESWNDMLPSNIKFA